MGCFRKSAPRFQNRAGGSGGAPGGGQQRQLSSGGSSGTGSTDVIDQRKPQRTQCVASACTQLALLMGKLLPVKKTANTAGFAMSRTAACRSMD